LKKYKEDNLFFEYPYIFFHSVKHIMGEGKQAAGKTRLSAAGEVAEPGVNGTRKGR
jgi:hypothetical protein